MEGIERVIITALYGCGGGGVSRIMDMSSVQQQLEMLTWLIQREKLAIADNELVERLPNG